MSVLMTSASRNLAGEQAARSPRSADGLASEAHTELARLFHDYVHGHASFASFVNGKANLIKSMDSAPGRERSELTSAEGALWRAERELRRGLLRDVFSKAR